MYLESSEILDKSAASTVEFLARHQVSKTPENYELLFEYHLGRVPDLTRTIDVLLTNRQVVTDQTLDDLRRRFLSLDTEEEALRAAMARIDVHLQSLDVAGQIEHRRNTDNRSLSELIQQLRLDAQVIASRSKRLGQRLKHSGQRIDVLQRTLEDVRRDASVDSLTGIANRRCFDLSIRELAGHAMNSGDDLSLLLLDIDHFKSVNDTWGHLRGDEILRAVAATLRDQVRGVDRVFRYGGEEFAILLPGTALAVAGRVADRIRIAVASRQSPAESDRLPPVTISAGGACYVPGEPLAAWVKRTDDALYRAKREGRDRVVLS